MNLSKLLLLVLILNYAKSLHINQYFDSTLELYGLRLPGYIKPDHYEITLEQQDEESNKNFFRGICVIFIRMLYSTQRIYLHAQRPHIELDTIVVHQENSTYYGIVPTTVTYYNANHVYGFFYDKELIKGHYVLNISFNTFLDNNEENFFEMRYKNTKDENEWMLATQFHPIGARQVFPCFDDPWFKATFNISIKHFSHYTALSNMPARNTTRVSQTMIWTHFSETPVMSTHLVAIMLSEFPNTSVKEVNFRYHTLQSAFNTDFAQRVIEDISLYFESKWLCFQKLPKVDHIAIPNFLRDGVEYWGLIFYREEAITFNERLESIGRRVDVARLIARNIAYQWYGNLISPDWWSHAWLYEGLTTLLATDALNDTYPEFRIWDLFVVQIQQESLRLNSVIKPLASEVTSPSDINTLFSFSYYLKGPALLRMFRRAVSNKLFDKAMKEFLSTYSKNADKFWLALPVALDSFFLKSTAPPSYFWTVLQHTLQQSDVIYPWFDITDMTNPWIYPPQHYPVVKLSKKTNNESTSMVISVENYDSWKEKVPWIPVTRVTLEFDNTMYWNPDVTWLKPTDNDTTSYKDIIINFDFHWILINVEQAGYYRVYYEDDNWRNIANYLNDINNYTKIHVLNRAQIIDDAFYFAIRGQLELSIFFKLSEYLRHERDYIVWFPMFKALEYMSTFFLFPESIDIKMRMKVILHDLLDNIGYLETFNDDDFTKSLRQEAAKWACTLSVSQCLDNATFNLLHHLRNHEGHKILPWWKRWTFCNGLMMSEFENSTWWSLFDEWKTSNAIIEFVSCSRSSYVIHNYLNLTINATEDCNSENKCKNANMLAKKRINRFLYIVAKQANDETVLEYIKENYEKIKPREVSTIATFIIIINHIYSKERLEKVRNVVKYLLQHTVQKYITDIPHIFLDQKVYLDKINIYVKNKLKVVSTHISDKIAKRIFEISEQKVMFDNLKIK